MAATLVLTTPAFINITGLKPNNTTLKTDDETRNQLPTYHHRLGKCPVAGAGSNPGVSAGAFANARRQDRHRPLDRPTLRQRPAAAVLVHLGRAAVGGVPPHVALEPHGARIGRKRCRPAHVHLHRPPQRTRGGLRCQGIPRFPGRGVGAAFPQYVGKEFRAAHTREGRGFRHGLPRRRSAENPLCRRQQDFEGRLCAPHRGIPHGAAAAHRAPRRTFVGGGFPLLQPRIRGFAAGCDGRRRLDRNVVRRPRKTGP